MIENEVTSNNASQFSSSVFSALQNSASKVDDTGILLICFLSLLCG
jgi:hypothetical protein